MVCSLLLLLLLTYASVLLLIMQRCLVLLCGVWLATHTVASMLVAALHAAGVSAGHAGAGMAVVVTRCFLRSSARRVRQARGGCCMSALVRVMCVVPSQQAPAQQRCRSRRARVLAGALRRARVCQAAPFHPLSRACATRHLGAMQQPVGFVRPGVARTWHAVQQPACPCHQRRACCCCLHGVWSAWGKHPRAAFLSRGGAVARIGVQAVACCARRQSRCLVADSCWDVPACACCVCVSVSSIGWAD